jgi:hypothetical protein
MLFMIEIDKGNVNTAIKIFGQLAPGATANICCADTLALKDSDLVKEFGVSKFTVVMGNPPFNAPRTVSGTLRAAQNVMLWDTFVKLSLLKLLPGGYLAFITPQTWRKPEDPMWVAIMTGRQLGFLHILSKKQSNYYFHVLQKIDLYVIKNAAPTEKSIIIDEVGKVHLYDVSAMSFLPNYNYDDFQRILVSKDAGIDVIYDSSAYRTELKKGAQPKVVRTKTGEYIHPVVHGITTKGPVLWYSNTTSRGHFGVPKVLLNKNEQQYPINDFEGKYGMSELTFAIPIQTKEEGDLIVRAINTDRFKEIIKATKWGAFQTEYKMFKYFKPDFYKEFLPKEGGSRHRTRRANRRGTTRRQNGSAIKRPINL